MKRVAFLGRAGHTLPSHRALLNCIAKEWSVVVYSEVPVQSAWLNLEHRYELRSVCSRKLPRRLRDIVFFLKLTRDHLQNPFDVVHAHSTYPSGFLAVVFQIVFGVPALVSLDAAEASALPEIGFGDLLSKRRKRLNHWVIRRARIVTALTEFHRKEVVRNLNIKREIRVLPRGVDRERFFPGFVETRPATLTILSVGYMNPIKDPETLMYAFRNIRKEINCRLVVVGKDYTQGAVRALVGKLDLSDAVSFAGYVEHDLMPRFYRQADVMIHSSRYESQGVAVAEAMACGLVVVGTQVGLVSDLAPDCCLAVRPGDSNALAEAVIALVRNEEMMAHIRNNALDWATSNNLDVTCDKLKAVYHQLLDSE